MYPTCGTVVESYAETNANLPPGWTATPVGTITSAGFPATVNGQYCPLMLVLVAAVPMAMGVDPEAAVNGNTAIEPEQGEAGEQVGSGW